eukprot:scaffold34620_cov160-Amphora_coffeaeformis.AAC.20
MAPPPTTTTMGGKGSGAKRHKKRVGNKPLVPPPKLMSRKRARQVTTAFHKLTRQRAAAVDADTAERIDLELQALGGRKEYQKASQVSTSFHSTSKWVLGHLSRNGWLYGVPVGSSNDTTTTKQGDACGKSKKKERRTTRLLEVGAINTELLDAASPPQPKTPDLADESSPPPNNGNKGGTGKAKLHVRAIDLHCMDRRIEKADFLKIPVNHVNVDQRYDVLVCSMVLNCVPTAAARGEMVCRLYHFLRPGGFLFLTLPRTCLNLSPYMDKAHFANLLTTVGLEIHETKESPKIAFYLCERTDSEKATRKWDAKWSELRTIRQGKKTHRSRQQLRLGFGWDTILVLPRHRRRA